MVHQTDNETCDNCGEWMGYRDFPLTGRCSFFGDTSAGYSCGRWIAKSTRPKPGPSETKPGIDISSAADRIIKMKPKSVSIQFIQRRLRCSYSEAALIVEELRRRGVIK